MSVHYQRARAEYLVWWWGASNSSAITSNKWNHLLQFVCELSLFLSLFLQNRSNKRHKKKMNQQMLSDKIKQTKNQNDKRQASQQLALFCLRVNSS